MVKASPSWWRLAVESNSTMSVGLRLQKEMQQQEETGQSSWLVIQFRQLRPFQHTTRLNPMVI
jgi:hypothetical protein